MAIKKAKILSDEALENLLEFISIRKTDNAKRDRLMVLLSFKMGLRAMEIASLTKHDVTDAEGRIIEGFLPIVGKRAKLSVVALHPRVREAIAALLADRPGLDHLMYAENAEGGHMSANHVVVYLRNLYHSFGLDGCSSHSGRRTFITKAARTCNSHGMSLVDVQTLARHSDIRTTKEYIEPGEHLTKFALSL